MAKLGIKRIKRNLTALKYTLIIYYHRDMSIKDIYNEMIKSEEGLEKIPPEDQDRDESLVIIDDSGAAYLVLNGEVNCGIILHEVVHITTAIFDFIGSVHNDQTDEFYAYHAQDIYEYIVNTLINKFKFPAAKLLTFSPS